MSAVSGTMRELEAVRTNVKTTWTHLVVRNQYILLPSGGNMCGYDFVLLLSNCAAVMFWLYAPAPYVFVEDRALRRAPCDGGRNLSGCSRTMGFLGSGGDGEA